MILFLNGWSGSGKDTIGSILVEKHGFKRVAFADLVKEEVARNLKIPVDECFRHECKGGMYGNKTLREHIITHGEGMKRAYGNGYWAEQLIDSGTLEGISKIVITDWRHLEELLVIQKAYPTHTIVPAHVRRPSQLVSPVPDKTEYSLLGFPFSHTILNDQDIQALESKVSAFLFRVAAGGFSFLP